MHGPKLVVMVLLSLFAYSAFVGLELGATEEAIRVLIRVNARVAVVLFLLAFTASAVAQLMPSATARWLLRERRYVGLSFAVAHFFHLGTLVALGIAYPDPFVAELNLVTLVGGGLAYVLLAVMVVTSNDRAQESLGRIRWQRRHRFSSYYIWIVFFQNYVPRTFVEPFYIPLAAAVTLAPVVRFAARRQRATRTSRGMESIQNSA
jgi:sulfoxide reductase heme-binding subunit YedZ